LNMDHPMNALALSIEDPELRFVLIGEAGEETDFPDGTTDPHKWYLRARKLCDPHLSEEAKKHVDEVYAAWDWTSGAAL
jgi:hypothetical protein